MRVWLNRTFTTALFLTFAFFYAGVANGADINTQNRCDTRGENCVADCRDFIAQAEDDPCWLITSPNSDWEKPWLSLRVKDYRP